MCKVCSVQGRLAIQILVLTLFTTSFIGLSIADICIGINFLHGCDAEPLIPVFLIVFGASGLLIAACIILIFIAMFCTDKVCCNICLAVIGFILVLFYLVWLVAGTYWCASTSVSSDPTSDDYCHHGLYTYLISEIVISYVWLLVFVGIMIGCRDCWWGKSSPRAPPDAQPL